MMKKYFGIIGGLLLALSLLTGENLVADEVIKKSVPKCLNCHTEDADDPVHAIWKNVHGQIFPNSAETCVSCHGESQKHQRSPTKQKPSVIFSIPDENGEQANSCLNCHKDKVEHAWTQGTHQKEGLSCASCHTLHKQVDPVLQPEQQLNVCSQCHTRVKSDLNMPSRHPIKEGSTQCTACHNPHGSMNVANLTKMSLNETCLSCHAEKRGPFLFEHAPVAEDCSACHKPHGSVNQNLLTNKAPFLCQQCHMAANHPSIQFSQNSFSDSETSGYLAGKNCMSCHSKIHGTNHPSGAKLTR